MIWIANFNGFRKLLLNFQGSLIIVSHDRYFMDRIVDHVLAFEGEGKLKILLGIFRNIEAVLMDGGRVPEPSKNQNKFKMISKQNPHLPTSTKKN